MVMFDLEVTWPPPSTNSRVGGYEFLGGEAEAQTLKTKRVVSVCRLLADKLSENLASSGNATEALQSLRVDE